MFPLTLEGSYIGRTLWIGGVGKDGNKKTGDFYISIIFKPGQ